jgi:glycolate oxidase FAD binding subunit
VIHYEPGDMTLAVEPGCTIAQLAELLAAQGQQIPLDAARPEQATIGGAYATGLSSPRRLGGGSLKDWVIGVEVAGVDGVVAKAGGMVVKNVTGYDMMHLHYGALGAFGVVTRLNLKVFPRSGAESSIRLTYERAADAYAAGIAVLRSQLQPSALLVANDGGWNVHVRCDAPPGAIERQTARVIETASAPSVPVSVATETEGTAAVAPFTRVADLTRGRGVVRLSVPASRQADVLGLLSEMPGQEIRADLGSGVVYIAAAASLDWVTQVRAIDRRAVFLALPPECKHEIDVFGGLGEAEATIVRRLKDAFDPARRMNRGRFVLGL